jgi:hypothetical protein
LRARDSGHGEGGRQRQGGAAGQDGHRINP